MAMPHGFVFVTISVAVMCWAAAEVLRSRVWWMAGAVLAVVHSLAAFAVFYDWNHETARRLTMQQTMDATGIAFSGGIYVNYVFLAVWLADAMWWSIAPRSYHRRPPLVSLLIRGFIFFIIVNGAVVFADGWARIVGFVSTLVVLIAWLQRRSLRPGAFSTAG